MSCDFHQLITCAQGSVSLKLPVALMVGPEDLFVHPGSPVAEGTQRSLIASRSEGPTSATLGVY